MESKWLGGILAVLSKEPWLKSQKALELNPDSLVMCETWSILQSLDWKSWLRNRVMVVLDMATWPNCCSCNFCWIKFEIRLSACFPPLMSSRQFAECGSFQNRGGMTTTSQHLSSCARVSWPNRVTLFWTSPSCSLQDGREGPGFVRPTENSGTLFIGNSTHFCISST